MCDRQKQKVITYNDLISIFQDVTLGSKMEEILQYVAEQGKPLIPQSEVIGKILEDLGLGTSECIASVLTAFGIGYFSIEFGFWPVLLGVELGLCIASLFNRKERALKQLQELDKKIEMVRKKCEWYFSNHMDASENEKFIACLYILGPMIADMKEKLVEFMKKFGDGEKELCFLTIKYNVNGGEDDKEERREERENNDDVEIIDQ